MLTLGLAWPCAQLDGDRVRSQLAGDRSVRHTQLQQSMLIAAWAQQCYRELRVLRGLR